MDGEPPRPPQELDPDPAERRELDIDGVAWVAWVAGKGAWGAGAYGLGMVEAVHFALAAKPDEPLREALLARGRFASLFEEELRVLWERAVAVTKEAPARKPGGGRGERRGRDW